MNGNIDLPHFPFFGAVFHINTANRINTKDKSYGKESFYVIKELHNFWIKSFYEVP